MARTPPEGTQRIVPYLVYADAPSAIEFLCDAFGFTERFRYPMEDGKIGHAELEFGDSAIMLASVFEGFGESPLNLPAVSCFVYCFVNDVEAHFRKARDAGVTIVSEPLDEHGQRMYRAMDPEGHRWIFATVLD